MERGRLRDKEVKKQSEGETEWRRHALKENKRQKRQTKTEREQSTVKKKH